MQDEHIEGFCWGAIATVIIFAIMFLCSGCERTMTEAEWDAAYKPVDVNQAEAMVVLEQGKLEAGQRVKAQASIDWVKLICVGGCIAAIAAIVLGTSGIKSLGFSALVICLASIALIQFYQTYTAYFAYSGGVIALCAGGRAIITHRKALVQAVKTGEVYKANITTDMTEIGNKIKTEVQSPTTTKLISSIRAKL